MKEATLRQLGLSGISFPPEFAPRFCTKGAAEGYDGIWHAHESEPSFQNGEWSSPGQVYEIGIDPTPDLDHTPYVGRGLSPENAVFKIVSEDRHENSTMDAEVQIAQDTQGLYFIRIEDGQGVKEVRLTPKELAKAVTGKLAKATTND